MEGGKVYQIGFEHLKDKTGRFYHILYSNAKMFCIDHFVLGWQQTLASLEEEGDRKEGAGDGGESLWKLKEKIEGFVFLKILNSSHTHIQTNNLVFHRKWGAILTKNFKSLLSLSLLKLKEKIEKREKEGAGDGFIFLKMWWWL